jgi:signal transduction histidine kinase
MDQPQAVSEEIAKAQGEGKNGPIDRIAAVHVDLRIESGFDLVQIIAEYRALRSCVPRLWRISYPESFAAGAAEIVRFCEAIDQNIAEAIPHYQEQELHYRDRFLGMLGHDMRNPIQSISVCATLLAKQGLNDEQQGTLRRIMGRLGSPMPLALARTNLEALMRDEIDGIKNTHPEVAIQLDANGDTDGTWDAERLKQLISNLLLNAIQYGSGERITVTTAGEQDAVVLEVHNDGIRIRPELITTIFDPLVRGDDSNQDHTGLGLGLCIVKESSRRITAPSLSTQLRTQARRLPFACHG